MIQAAFHQIFGVAGQVVDQFGKCFGIHAGNQLHALAVSVRYQHCRPQPVDIPEDHAGNFIPGCSVFSFHRLIETPVWRYGLVDLHIADHNQSAGKPAWFDAVVNLRIQHPAKDAFQIGRHAPFCALGIVNHLRQCFTLERNVFGLNCQSEATRWILIGSLIDAFLISVVPNTIAPGSLAANIAFDHSFS